MTDRACDPPALLRCLCGWEGTYSEANAHEQMSYAFDNLGTPHLIEFVRPIRGGGDEVSQ